MPKIILVILFALTLSSLEAQSAAPTPEMKAALKELAASQDLEINWARMLENESKTGAMQVKRGFMEKLDSTEGVSPEKRAQAIALIESWSHEIAADIHAMHSKLDVGALVIDMVEEVYPKYFKASEVREMAAFYRSAAFKKVVDMSLRAEVESARTGEKVEIIMAKYEKGLSPQDTRVFLAFHHSATGKKLSAVSDKLKKDNVDFIQARTQKAFDDVLDRQAKILKERVEAINVN